MQDKKKLKYSNGIDDDESSRIDSSPGNFPVFKRPVRKLYRFAVLIAGLIIAISLVANIFLAHKCLTLTEAVNNSIATNKESEDKANGDIQTAITATQSELEKYKLSTDALTTSQNAMIGEIARELRYFKTTGSFVEPAPVKDCPDKDFLTVGTKWETDKVVKAHVYNRLYEPYFHPVRCNPIKILEIGLGCDMPYGPGHSFNLWLEYFPFAEIYFIEYDKKCVDEWKDKNPRVHLWAGDQSDRAFLRNFITESGGSFDFIIDDGGHDMDQQIVSLEELVPALKPGGTYFLEDLLSSFWFGRNDDTPTTTLNYIKHMMSDLMTRRAKLQPNIKPITNEITRIDCIDEMCAFTRKV